MAGLTPEEVAGAAREAADAARAAAEKALAIADHARLLAEGASSSGAGDTLVLQAGVFILAILAGAYAVANRGIIAGNQTVLLISLMAGVVGAGAIAAVARLLPGLAGIAAFAALAVAAAAVAVGLAAIWRVREGRR